MPALLLSTIPCRSHERIAQLADKGTVTFIGEEVRAVDPLEFFDLRPYPERISEAQLETGLTEAFLAAIVRDRRAAGGAGRARLQLPGRLDGLGGRGALLPAGAGGRRGRAPLVVVAGSGGARMQEGLFSLMQMAKTVVRCRCWAKPACPTSRSSPIPTTGGVFASFATVADVILAEPGAVMSFAGARIIEQTTREKLPPGFGSSESQLAHGQVDMVVDRRELQGALVGCSRFLREVGTDG